MLIISSIAAAAAVAVSPTATANTPDPHTANSIPAADPASLAPPAPTEDQAVALAKKLSNPIASLISVPLQNNMDWGAGPEGDGVQYKLNIQPVIPIALNAKWNVISRTIVPLIAQKRIIPSPPASDNSQFGLGDTVQSFFFSPQETGKSGIIWGAGPVFLFRTGTGKFLSAEKWGAGPTFVVLKQTGGLTVGALANHIWSFAGAEDHDNVSATLLQPFMSYTTRTATTFSINTETTYDWVNRQWTVPVNLMVAQLLAPKKTGLPFPMQVQLGVRHYFETPRNGPENGVRLAITALFPRK